MVLETRWRILYFFELSDLYSSRSNCSKRPRELLKLSTDLGGPEAEGSRFCVRLLPVLQYQSTVLGQSQVMACREVAKSEGLAPSDVAT